MWSLYLTSRMRQLNARVGKIWHGFTRSVKFKQIFNAIFFKQQNTCMQPSTHRVCLFIETVYYAQKHKSDFPLYCLHNILVFFPPWMHSLDFIFILWAWFGIDFILKRSVFFVSRLRTTTGRSSSITLSYRGILVFLSISGGNSLWIKSEFIKLKCS